MSITSEDIKLNLNEYNDLKKLDRDELFFALPYELYIRANKDHYKKYFSHFKIENNKLKMIKFPEIKYYLYPEWETDTKEKLEKIAFEQLYRDYFGYMGNNGVANPHYLYLDYHFFTDEEKEIGKLLKEIFKPKQSSWEKQLNGTDSITYPKENGKYTFYRTDTRKEIDTRDFNYKGYESEQSYEIIYKRPKLFLLSSHKKTIKQEININLPKHIILAQLDKIISMAKKDTDILTNEDRMKISYFDKNNPPELSKTIINDFDKKNFVKDLFCYDYFMLRFDELQNEREKEIANKKQELEEIKTKWEFDTQYKNRLKSEINQNYPELRKKIETKIYEELENMDIGILTRKIKDNIENIKSLIDENNYIEHNHYMNFLIGYSKTNK